MDANQTDFIDTWLRAKTGVKKLHDAMLIKDYDMAMNAAADTVADLRMTAHAIRLMKENDRALREQAPTV